MFLTFGPSRDVDFGEVFGPEIRSKHPVSTYNLLANIVHDGEPGKGTYRVHILHKATGKWFEMQDLHVTEILPQMLTLTEAYIQVKGSRFPPTKRSSYRTFICTADLGTVEPGEENRVNLRDASASSLILSDNTRFRRLNFVSNRPSRSVTIFHPEIAMTLRVTSICWVQSK
jgi:hypothetical protein